MKRYIKSSGLILDEESSLEKAIKGYTAQGGQLATMYPFTRDMKNLLYSEASNNKIKIQDDIWRKVDISASEYESIFNELYEKDKYLVTFNNLQSFTKDRTRCFTFGGTHMQYVIYKIPAGSYVNGVDIQDYSIYPEEEEILLGSNRFEALYSELDWTHSNNMIITLNSI